ncbi:MAG: DivIVA domain-containing protein [Nitritalea sp.]
MKISATHLRTLQLERVFRGYDPRAIDELFAHLATTLEEHEETTQALMKKYKESQEDSERLRKVEKSLFLTLQTAEDTAAKLLADATQESQRVREEAEAYQQRVREEAEAKALRMREEAEAEALRMREEAATEVTALLAKARQEAEVLAAQTAEQTANFERLVKERSAAIIAEERAALQQVATDVQQVLEARKVLFAEIERMHLLLQENLAASAERMETLDFTLPEKLLRSIAPENWQEDNLEEEIAARRRTLEEAEEALSAKSEALRREAQEQEARHQELQVREQELASQQTQLAALEQRRTQELEALAAEKESHAQEQREWEAQMAAEREEAAAKKQQEEEAAAKKQEEEEAAAAKKAVAEAEEAAALAERRAVTALEEKIQEASTQEEVTEMPKPIGTDDQEASAAVSAAGKEEVRSPKDEVLPRKRVGEDSEKEVELLRKDRSFFDELE